MPPPLLPRVFNTHTRHTLSVRPRTYKTRHTKSPQITIIAVINERTYAYVRHHHSRSLQRRETTYLKKLFFEYLHDDLTTHEREAVIETTVQQLNGTWYRTVRARRHLPACCVTYSMIARLSQIKISHAAPRHAKKKLRSTCYVNVNLKFHKKKRKKENKKTPHFQKAPTNRRASLLHAKHKQNNRRS